MKHEKLCDALEQVSDAHIAEAAEPKKKLRLSWVGAVAAVAAVAILVSTLFPPAANTSPGSPAGSNNAISGRRFLVAAPVYPEMVKFSDDNWREWHESQDAQHDQPEGYASGTENFFKTSIQSILAGGTQNTACSPVNIYMALAMLAESADGNSRDQVLNLLGSDSLEALRTQAGHMWNAHYQDDGVSTSVLANSLWLDTETKYHSDVVQKLSDSYYTSVYQGDLGSVQMEQALQEWLNAQTRGLLQEQAAGIELDDDCLLALASTIYYNVQWFDNFNEANNYQGMFHAPGGDREVTYMCHVTYADTYYWGEGFGAMELQLFDGSKMWLILPDEGSTPAEVLAKGEALDLVLGDAASWENQKDVLAKLSVPKFDITCKTDLIPVMKELGVTDLFDWNTADLSALIQSSDAYVNQAEHTVRVSIDENGVVAAAFTAVTADNTVAAPMEDEIAFTLDRPFLFIIESRDSMPLFAGVVNKP